MKKIAAFFPVLILLFSGIGCTQSKKTGSPEGYDLADPAVYKMPAVLEEISGITFLNGNADILYAEQDEEGKLFYFGLGDKEVSHTKFSKRGDFEDLAISNGYVVMLRSDGTLFTFPLTTLQQPEIDTVNEQKGLVPEGEYEGMCADETGNVYILCKSCSADKKSETVSGYRLQLDTGGKLVSSNVFSIVTKEIAALAGEKKVNFKPSALAKNKLTNEWYVVSSVNRMLLVTDDQWKPKRVYLLGPSLFTQPEGIAFDKDNNLYISNEMGEAAHGTVLRFLYKKK